MRTDHDFSAPAKPWSTRPRHKELWTLQLIDIMGISWNTDINNGYIYITNSWVFFTFCMRYCLVGYLYNIYICNIHGCNFMGIFMQTNHDTWGYHGIYIYTVYVYNQLLLNTWVDWIN